VSRLIVWFSCGAASAIACKIALNNEDYQENFDEIVIAYCKVKEEHPDNERFLKECEKWFNHPIKTLMHEGYEGSIYKVFEKNYMRTPNGSPCTRALKKQVRGKFQKPDDVHVFGYTLEETVRADDFERRNKDLMCEFPLIEEGIDKGNCLSMIKNAGIELPVMYKLGYEHNNCIGCVKGGMGYWNKIRQDFPDEFKKMADFEKKKGYTVLKEPTSKKPESGRPIFLHDLDPNRGDYNKEPKIECGFECQIVESKYSKNK